MVHHSVEERVDYARYILPPLPFAREVFSTSVTTHSPTRLPIRPGEFFLSWGASLCALGVTLEGEKGLCVCESAGVD